ncbi:hypothetical protein C3747_153g84 [Trypanosoma cruzi]|uniref:Peptidase M41 domain-containing protein n=2 Tax=Trypanosoma cruzi TaxID=5693 RepID=Q4DB84_TRYCC|nr:hypothetical protein, conserved [Trypanosoma cruzi]EAN89787.1 hypothetical protein, conserved [Trypanosoma cruzi]PWV04391.1 hypothetical protein C3747_153g84 [Trypanosoma cruzi]RNC32711.1 ATP-dependent zinc metallopeptidase [Trypanosoma cruzi]|eukprot:XP_811638.1 hypothetical protein [Trypanosoma cruzi strain CL Brener]
MPVVTGIRKGFLDGVRLYGAGGSGECNRPTADSLLHFPERLRNRCQVIDTRQLVNGATQVPAAKETDHIKEKPKQTNSNITKKEACQWEVQSVDCNEREIVVRLHPPPNVMSMKDVELTASLGVIEVSITPRGPAAGFTQQVGKETFDMPTDVSLFTDICVMLAGRLAEATRHAELTTGTQEDYQRATKTAIHVFLAFGMSHHVGFLAFEPQRLDEGRIYQKHSEKIQAVAEEEAARLVGTAQQYTKTLIAENKELLHRLADAIFTRKELLKEDLEAILGPRGAARLSLEAEKVLTAFVQKSEKHGTTVRSTSG